jgi:hypothetical protein
VEGGFVHFFVRVVGAEMTASTGLRVPGLFQRKAMRSMATVTPFLDDVAALAKGRADLLGDAQIFSMDAHPFPSKRMATFPKFFQLLRVTVSASFGKDHGFLLGCSLVVHMAGHTVDSLLGMFRFRPGLKKAGAHSLVTFHAKPGVHLGRFGTHAHAGYP